MISMMIDIFQRRYAHRQALLIIFLAASLWGVLWVPMRHAESYGLNGLWVVTLFHLLPAMAIWPFIAKAYFADRQYWLISIFAGGLMGVGFVLYGLGLVVASVTKTTVLFYLTPVWATCFATMFLAERVGFGRWLAISGGLLGCLLVMRVNPFAFAYERADLLGLLSGMAWALGSVVIRRYPQADFLHITFMQYFVGALLAGGAALFLGRAVPTSDALLAALPVAFVASTVIFLPSVLLIFRIMQYVSPGLVGILMLSEVLVAALSSWLFLDEALTLWQWVGVVAILGTGVFVGLTEKPAPHA